MPERIRLRARVLGEVAWAAVMLPCIYASAMAWGNDAYWAFVVGMIALMVANAAREIVRETNR